MSTPTTDLGPVNSDRLAILFQEILTVVVRVRTNRQTVPNMEQFRAHVRHAVMSAQEQAQRHGYSADEAFLGTQAVVAFLDESVLNSRNPQFLDWARQPLGPEFFRQHVAGEVFFHSIHKLLSGDESQRTADALELYLHCLLLGYRGRFGGREGDVRTIADKMLAKIQRIRQSSEWICPRWMPEGESLPREEDPWSRLLLFGAGAVFALLLICFAVYFMLLRSDVFSLAAAAILSAAEGAVSC